MNNNEYIIESLELNAVKPDAKLVWILNTYNSEHNEEESEVISVQCIINLTFITPIK